MVYMALIAAVVLLLALVQPLITAKFHLKMATSIVLKLLDCTFYKHPAFFRRYEAGYVLPRILYEVNDLQALYGTSFVAIVFQFGTFWVAVLRIWKISATLSIVILLLLPLYILIGKLYTPKIKNCQNRQKEAHSRLSDCFVSHYNGLLILQLYQAVSWSLCVIREKVLNLMTARYRTIKVNTHYSVLSGGAGIIAPFLVLTLGGREVFEHRMTIGQLFEILGYLPLLFAPFNKISAFYSSIIQAQVVLDRLKDLLGGLSKPDLDDENRKPYPTGPDEQIGRLELLQLGCDMEGGSLFEDVSVQLDPGDTLLIKGDSGAGKTTLLEMIVGLQMPTTGRIRFNGNDQNQVSRTWIISRTAYVSATSPLVRGTVADNILLGLREVTDTDILDSLKQVGLIEKTQSFPDGIHTDTNDPSVSGLSQGERQRLALARALLKNPDLLILDEATSNLDEASEKKIMELIQQLFQDKMIIIVSHNYKPYFNANKFIELGAGSP